MFAYENASLGSLFDAWSVSEQPVLCLVPEGRIMLQVNQYFGDTVPEPGKVYAQGSLQVRVLPFVEQERYDELLWSCDINFVRGEDSCVRAQWAGKPFIWQIYPQHDAVHWGKLDAFLKLYGSQLGLSASKAAQDLWLAWNRGSGAGQGNSITIMQAWPAFMETRNELELHTWQWANHLADNNLALNLLEFFLKIGRMRGLKIEGQ